MATKTDSEVLDLQKLTISEFETKGTFTSAKVLCDGKPIVIQTEKVLMNIGGVIPYQTIEGVVIQKFVKDANDPKRNFFMLPLQKASLRAFIDKLDEVIEDQLKQMDPTSTYKRCFIHADPKSKFSDYDRIKVKLMTNPKDRSIATNVIVAGKRMMVSHIDELQALINHKSINCQLRMEIMWKSSREDGESMVGLIIQCDKLVVCK